jgi:hypothetical protein
VLHQLSPDAAGALPRMSV